MTNPIESDFQQLWMRCRAGDVESQRLLFERYGPDLRRCVRVHLRDPRLRRIADSMDLCQTVVRRLMAGADRYDFASFGKFQALVSQIVRSRIAKMRRKLLNQLAAEYRAAERRSSDMPITDPSHPHELAEFRQFLRNTLSPDEDWLFVACFVKGRSYVEVAAEKGVSPDVVRKRVDRLKTFLRELLDDGE